MLQYTLSTIVLLMPAAYGARSADIWLNSLLVDSRSGALLSTARLLAMPPMHNKMKVTVQPGMLLRLPTIFHCSTAVSPLAKERENTGIRQQLTPTIAKRAV